MAFDGNHDITCDSCAIAEITDLDSSGTVELMFTMCNHVQQLDWKRTRDCLPTTEPCEQVKVMMYTQGATDAVYGMYTCWSDGAGEWAEYDQQEDKYYEYEGIPDYFCVVTLPIASR